MLTRLFATLLAATLVTLPTVAHARQEGWTQDFAAAKATAAREHKDLLLYFTGSDWCVFCIKLDKEVFGTPEFRAAVPKDFVPVMLDFPEDEKRVTPEVKQQNEKLRDEWQIHEYPTVVLADASGKPYASTGYGEGGPGPWLENLAQLKVLHANRDKFLKEAEGKQGLERAKLLDSALSGIDPKLLVVFYVPKIDELLRLAKDDAELTRKYSEVLDQRLLEEIAATYRQFGKEGDGEGAIEAMREYQAKYKDRPALFLKAAMLEMDATFNETARKGDWDAVLKAMGEFETSYKDQPALLQKALMNKSMGFLMKQQVDECIQALEASLALDPKSALAPQLERMLANVKKKGSGAVK